MDQEIIRYAALILFGILVYAVLTRGLFNATEGHRREAFRLAEKIGHSAQATDQNRHRLNICLDDVHSGWQAWKLVGYLILVMVKLPFYDYQKALRGVDGEFAPHLRKDHDRFITCWMLATLGNSPIALFVFTTLTLVLVAFFVSLSMISKLCSAVADSHGRDSIAT